MSIDTELLKSVLTSQLQSLKRAVSHVVVMRRHDGVMCIDVMIDVSYYNFDPSNTLTWSRLAIGTHQASMVQHHNAVNGKGYEIASYRVSESEAEDFNRSLQKIHWDTWNSEIDNNIAKVIQDAGN